LIKKLVISLIVIICTISLFSGYQIYQDTLKIESLEEELATKNLHYGWLSEITDYLVSNNTDRLFAYGLNHTNYTNYTDSDWECKKTIGMWELAKQDFPHFIENTKWLADKKCGFDVSLLLESKK